MQNASLAEYFRQEFGLLGDYLLDMSVKNNAPWDYKQLDRALYEDFGNFHFGVVGAAFGHSEDVLTRMAGWAQVRAGTAEPGGVAPYMVNGLLGRGGRAPYRDNWNDQYWIKQGAQYYRENKGK